ARHQNSATEKLAWDEQCLALAQSIPGEPVQSTYPSLYLNIAKCHEDLGNKQEALRHYKLASSFEHLLADDGYGSMIKAGIKKGLQRVQ
ncbi:MAG TPA: hypothetical protein VHB48_21775, partial [Chitinophagaceae bacterium]|nr:hypothetical protein [Chitinophagaceae bacterium]